ncbi:MAG TPA: hypothetical protein VMH77_05495 [Steroidobacteraceae bacterium]|nr:hypothetical protein [Steroidobacteraceae bacterium]
MRRSLLAAAALLAVLVAMRLAGGMAYWERYAAALAEVGAGGRVRLTEPRIRVAGQPAGVPRATPAAENLLPAALEDARRQALRQGLRALVVQRHGHRVFDYFAAGRNGADEVTGGELAALPFALAVGVLADNHRVSFGRALEAVRGIAAAPAGWRNPWSQAAHERFTLHPAPALLRQDADGDVAATLSQRVWQPLGAGDAWLWGRDDRALRVDCCMVARLDDWMRLGDLLLGTGTREGERIVSPDWIRLLLARDADGHAHPVWLARQAPWRGDEPPAERSTYWLDLGPDLRLWLAPRRGLAVLVWASGGKAQDTLIPNIILRGLNDQAPPTGGGLDDLVPGH